MPLLVISGPVLCIFKKWFSLPGVFTCKISGILHKSQLLCSLLNLCNEGEGGERMMMMIIIITSPESFSCYFCYSRWCVFVVEMQARSLLSVLFILLLMPAVHFLTRHCWLGPWMMSFSVTFSGIREKNPVDAVGMAWGRECVGQVQTVPCTSGLLHPKCLGLKKSWIIPSWSLRYTCAICSYTLICKQGWRQSFLPLPHIYDLCIVLFLHIDYAPHKYIYTSFRTVQNISLYGCPSLKSLTVHDYDYVESL